MKRNSDKDSIKTEDPLEDEERLLEEYQKYLSKRIPYLLRIAHVSFLQSLAKKLRPHNISISMWYHLRALWYRNGLTQTQLKSVVKVTGPATFSVINKLENEGLVSREKHDRDKRKSKIFLTKKGIKIEKQINDIAKEVYNTSVKGIPKQDTEIFKSVLSKMIYNLQDSSDDSKHPIQNFNIESSQDKLN